MQSRVYESEINLFICSIAFSFYLDKALNLALFLHFPLFNYKAFEYNVEKGKVMLMYQFSGNNMSLDDLIRISRFHEEVSIHPSTFEGILKARKFIEDSIEKEQPIYGINTGFGKLSDVVINKKDTSLLQKNLLMSHACGVGEVLPKDIIRGMMALRINALVKGYSGIRLSTIEKLVEFLNNDFIPVVFEKGSLGASGDLAPLSHMSLPLIGLGEVLYQGKRMSSKEAYTLSGLKPLDSLEAKEGLSLINGTQALTSVGAHALYDAIVLWNQANLSYALSMQALEGITDIFHPLVHELRGHLGQQHAANQMAKCLEGSQLTTKQGEKRVQDAYSLRCAPQVHGAIFDTLSFVKNTVETEMNAVTDNPIVIAEENRAISAGNFHGEPLAFAFDYLGIALSELANIAERRIERMVNSSLSNGLPSFLVKKVGINSGFMIVQYSAASLVSENKVLSHPASVDSIPSSANQEDHVSMGSISAQKASTILSNSRKVIAMEIFTALQAIDFRNPEMLSEPTKKVYNEVRKHVPFIHEDQVMYPFIHRIESMLEHQLIGV